MKIDIYYLKSEKRGRKGGGEGESEEKRARDRRERFTV
jgi:hypothetical protein